MCKNFLFLILFFILFGFQTKGQEIVSYSLDQKSIRIKIKFNKIASIDSTEGIFKFRSYLNGMDEIPPHFPLYVALPEYSKIIVKTISKKSNEFNKTIPKVFSTQNNLLNSEKNITYFRYREYFGAKIDIPLISYEKSNSITKELTETELEIKIENGNFPKLDKVISTNNFGNFFINKGHLSRLKTGIKWEFNDTTGSWINYNNPYLKITIAEDSLYRIYQEDFVSLGIPTDFNPKTLKLYYKGSEIPIYIYRESDEIFDEGDYIEFIGLKNYSNMPYRDASELGKEYNEYMNRYTDTSYYFLTWNGELGKRFIVDSSALISSQDTINYFNKLIHLEKNDDPDVFYQPASGDNNRNNDPLWLEKDTWWWQFITSTTTSGYKDYLFNIDEVATNKSSKLYFKGVSWAAPSGSSNNAHHIEFKMNDQILGSQYYNKQDFIIYETEFHNSILISNNKLRVTNLYEGIPNSILVDWVELEYTRKLKAENNYLNFSLTDFFSEEKVNVRIDEFSSDTAFIYKYAPKIKLIKNYSLINNQLVFADTLDEKNNYIISGNDKYSKPVSLEIINFRNLRSNINSADYILLTHKRFENYSDDYRLFIEEEYNLSTILVDIEDIYNEFGYGFPVPESIKEFIKASFSYWSGELPKYLFIVGSSSYDYKNLLANSNPQSVVNYNYIPSFGEPVSDFWFSVLDENVPLLAQLLIGRLPALKNQDVSDYLNAHQNYLEDDYNIWNKRVLLFSGGIDPQEYPIFKSYNDNLKETIFEEYPYGLNTIHFYRLDDPPRPFGPYSQEYIDEQIGLGGQIISYIGHSATEQWDNNIQSTTQLDNIFSKKPLITDFGCSTGRFAEPDVICFGTKFINSGKSIAYIGNSGLGSRGAAQYASEDFFQSLMPDTINYFNIISALNDGKIKYNNRVFGWINSFLGDPVVNLKIPTNPNLIISENDVILNSDSLLNNSDSLSLFLAVNNYGLMADDSVDIEIIHQHKDTLVANLVKRLKIPSFSDTLSVKIFTKDKTGSNNLIINLDASNETEEIYENDNSVIFEFIVPDNKLKYIPSTLITSISSVIADTIKIIRPVNIIEDVQYFVQIDTTFIFENPIEIQGIFNSFSKEIYTSSLNENRRYYLRSSIDAATEWTNPVTFYKKGAIKGAGITDLQSFINLQSEKLEFKENSISVIDSVKKEIEILSLGGCTSTGGYVKIDGDFVNITAAGWGMMITILDKSNFGFIFSRFYNYGNEPSKIDSVISLIEGIEDDKLVICNIVHDGSATNAGTIPIELKNSIASLGSLQFSNLNICQPWILIGGKQIPPDEVIELIGLSNANDSLIYLGNLTNKTGFQSGYVLTDVIGPAKSWKEIYSDYISSDDNLISITPIGIKGEGAKDTLQSFFINNQLTTINNISAQIYPYIEFRVELFNDADSESPKLKEFIVDYEYANEIGLLTKGLLQNKDTIISNTESFIDFSLYNVGNSELNDLEVGFYLLDDNSNIIRTSTDTFSVNNNEELQLTGVINTINLNGLYRIKILADPNQKIIEHYLDNNFIEKTVFIKDTTLVGIDIAELIVLFDGKDIQDGDYIDKQTNILFELNYGNRFPYKDTTEMSIWLNEKRVYYNELDSINFDTINNKIRYSYRPSLREGNYTLFADGTNIVGNITGTSGYQKNFKITDFSKIENVYNYPNPFSTQTYFTFILTKIPDKLFIKVFTIAGRMIYNKEIDGSELSLNFNRIFWDGLDNDGDIPANGVYLYKMTVIDDGKAESVIQKMAIIK